MCFFNIILNNSMISYPRKCPECEYVANNPAMYSYHKKTHEPIPVGKLCDHGCGQIATVRGTGGKYSCLLNSHKCPAYLKSHSARVKEQWTRPDALERKEKTKESLVNRLHNVETIKRIKETKRKIYGNFTPEQMKDFRHYARRIRARAQKWAKEQGYVLGRQSYHVDHKFSIWDSWLAGLPESIVNHPANLQILEAKINESKGRKSLLTMDELLNLTN